MERISIKNKNDLILLTTFTRGIFEKK